LLQSWHAHQLFDVVPTRTLEILMAEAFICCLVDVADRSAETRGPCYLTKPKPPRPASCSVCRSSSRAIFCRFPLNARRSLAVRLAHARSHPHCCPWHVMNGCVAVHAQPHAIARSHAMRSQAQGKDWSWMASGAPLPTPALHPRLGPPCRAAPAASNQPSTCYRSCADACRTDLRVASVSLHVPRFSH
jgi:hypothetical protein